MIRINLLPVRANQKKDKLRDQIIITVAALVITVVGCGAAFTMVLAKVSQKSKQIKEQQATIEQLKKRIGEVDKVTKFKEELQKKLDVLNMLKNNKSGPAHMFDELSSAIPEKLWIDSFENVGGALTLSGMGVSEEIVAEFLRRLEASPYIAKVELKSLEQAIVSGNKLSKFKISASEESPAAKAAPEEGNADQNKQQPKKS